MHRSMRIDAITAILIWSLTGMSACHRPGHFLSPPHDTLRLWYRQAAGNWNEALPIGDGKTGAMVFGGADTARFQLNDATLWSGGPA